jgi:SAM-dependent methyltransferase
MVVWAYRRLLDREPESEEVILAEMRLESPLALLEAILNSAEFRAHDATHRMQHYAPPLDVEWQVPPALAGQLLSRVTDTWEHLGEEQPYWSVLSSPEYLPENASTRQHSFYASGADDLRVLVATLARIGRRPTEFPVVFEFGCGLGRVTRHLCREFDRVIACDVSVPHLAIAQRMLSEHGISNASLVQAGTEGFGMSQSFDLWFSRLVLQHNPPPLIAAILEQALSMLRLKGVAVFQVPVYRAGYRFKIDEYLMENYRHEPFEIHALPQPAILEIGYRTNCRLLEIREDDSTGPPWISQFFAFEKM